MSKQRIVGLVALALGLATIFILIPVGIVSPQDVQHIALAPEFWPLIVASVFSVMALIILVRPTQPEESDDVESAVVPWKQRFPRLAVILVSLFAFYYLVPFLGMVFTGIVLIAGLMLYAGERRWKLIVPLAIVMPIALYLFFLKVANIPIPLGMFETMI